jgi:hypothetical protein
MAGFRFVPYLDASTVPEKRESAAWRALTFVSEGSTYTAVCITQSSNPPPLKAIGPTGRCCATGSSQWLGAGDRIPLLGGMHCPETAAGPLPAVDPGGPDAYRGDRVTGERFPGTDPDRSRVTHMVSPGPSSSMTNPAAMDEPANEKRRLAAELHDSWTHHRSGGFRQYVIWARHCLLLAFRHRAVAEC